MKVMVNKIRLQYDDTGQTEIVLTTNENKFQIQKEVMDLKQLVEKGKELTVEIKQYRHKRSLDANAYMWLLLGEIANALHTTKDEVYLQMLDRYGVYNHLVVKPNVVERVKEEWRTVRELGPVSVNGKEGIQLQCYFGSSTYDTKEMSVLIDGVVSECKELGIETLPPRELALLKDVWGKHGKAS